MPCSVGSYRACVKLETQQCFHPHLGVKLLPGEKDTLLKEGVSHLLDPLIEAGKLKDEGIV